MSKEADFMDTVRKYVTSPDYRPLVSAGAGGALGAGIGGLLGGRSGGFLGGTTGIIIGFLANAFFGNDIQKAIDFMFSSATPRETAPKAPVAKADPKPDDKQVKGMTPREKRVTEALHKKREEAWQKKMMKKQRKVIDKVTYNQNVADFNRKWGEYQKMSPKDRASAKQGKPGLFGWDSGDVYGWAPPAGSDLTNPLTKAKAEAKYLQNILRSQDVGSLGRFLNRDAPVDKSIIKRLATLKKQIGDYEKRQAKSPLVTYHMQMEDPQAPDQDVFKDFGRKALESEDTPKGPKTGTPYPGIGKLTTKAPQMLPKMWTW